MDNMENQTVENKEEVYPVTASSGVKIVAEEGLSKTQKMFYGGLAGAAIIVILLFLGAISYRALNKLADDQLTMVVTKTISLPAGFVNGAMIKYSDFVEDVLTVEQYYASQTGGQPAPALSEIRTSVWERQVKNAIVKKMAKGLGLAVSSKEVEDEYNSFVKSVGGADEALKTVKQNYGLNIENFKNKVVKPYLLQEKLTNSEKVSAALFNDAKKKADEVLVKVKEDKADFATLAKESSEDTGSKTNGGDLGWFGVGKMVKEFEEATTKLAPGQVSEPIKTRFGYHIIKLVEKREGKDGTEWRASHILIRSVDFNQYLSDLTAKSKIWKWIKI